MSAWGRLLLRADWWLYRFAPLPVQRWVLRRRQARLYRKLERMGAFRSEMEP
jgi:hypothetical protein